MEDVVRKAIARAWECTTKPAKYILGEGGRSPTASTPFTPDVKGTLGSDCIGFVLWCLQYDRYQPKAFPLYDGWCNCDSTMQDALAFTLGKKLSVHNKQVDPSGLWEIIERPEPGCLVIFPSLRDARGKMTRMGHVGIVVEVPAEFPTWKELWSSYSEKERKQLLSLVKVIDCNAGTMRKLRGKAIAQITAADLWCKADAVWVRLRKLP